MSVSEIKATSASIFEVKEHEYAIKHIDFASSRSSEKGFLYAVWDFGNPVRVYWNYYKGQ